MSRPSKTPILDALLALALDKREACIAVRAESGTYVFDVPDLSALLDALYWRVCYIKENPTEDTRARLKALSRWFVGLPRDRDPPPSWPAPLTLRVRGERHMEVTQRLMVVGNGV